MRLGFLGALVLVAAACGQAAPSGSPSAPSLPAALGPTRICDAAPDGAGLLLSCTEAIGGVLLTLGPDARFVRAAWFRPGDPCPPNARCMEPPPGSAYVTVRLEDGRIVLVRYAGETIVGEPATPTFDVWPPSGVAVPPVGRPETGPEAPPEVAARDPLPLCGDVREGVDDQRLARGCFFGAVVDGRPAELVVRSVDPAGDPIVEIYRFAGRGPVLVYRSATPAGPGWVRNDCAIASAFDDEITFVVAECLSTELS